MYCRSGEAITSASVCRPPPPDRTVIARSQERERDVGSSLEPSLSQHRLFVKGAKLGRSSLVLSPDEREHRREQDFEDGSAEFELEECGGGVWIIPQVKEGSSPVNLRKLAAK